MCVAETNRCDVLDVSAVLKALPPDHPVLTEDFAEDCVNQFAAFVTGEGVAEGADLANAVMAAVPDSRKSVLGVTEETAAPLVADLGLAPLTAETFTQLCRWAKAEEALELHSVDQPPVVGKILPAGLANDGVEIVEAACETLVNLPPQAGLREREGAMEKLLRKCHAASNPRGYRTCQREANRAVVPLLRAYEASDNHAVRARCLETVAACLAGYAEGAGACAKRCLGAMGPSLTLQAAADEQLAAVCLASALAPWGTADALRALVPTVAELTRSEYVFSTVRDASAGLLCQLAFHPEAALLHTLAGSFALSELRALLHRGVHRNDLLDVHLLVLLLAGETTQDGQPVAGLLLDVEAQGAFDQLSGALAASQLGQEFPPGSGAFRKPDGLLRCVVSAAPWCASQLHATLPAVVQLLDERPDAALAAVEALATARRNCLSLTPHLPLLQALADEDRAFGDGVLAAKADEVQAVVARRCAEPVPVYEAADFPRLLGSKATVQLRGLVAEGPTLYVAHADAAVAALGEYEVAVWDGSAPATRGAIAEYTSSFTSVVVAALEAHPALVCAALVADGALAAAWEAVGERFPGRVLFFRGWAAPLPGAAVVSVGLGGEGPLREAFAARAAGCADTWTVVPSGDAGDVWGGLALTTPCVLQDGKLAALNGEWSLHYDEAEEDWRLDG